MHFLCKPKPVCFRGSNQINPSESGLKGGCGLMKVLNLPGLISTKHFTALFTCVYQSLVLPHTYLCVLLSCWLSTVLWQLQMHNYPSVYGDILCPDSMHWFFPSHVKDARGLQLQMSWFLLCGSFAHGKHSNAMLARLITSLLSSCWLSSVVSTGLRRPPHVTLCCALSFQLRHSASFNLAFFFSLALLIPEKTAESRVEEQVKPSRSLKEPSRLRCN